MAKGYALHIGVNKVDTGVYSRKYNEVPPELKKCELEAEKLGALTEELYYTETKVLCGKNATTTALEDYLESIVKKLEPKDLFFLSFSGHGGQIDDHNGDEEKDGKDELWCLFDDLWIDDKLYAFLLTVPEGVRVLILSDSCYSGGMDRNRFVSTSGEGVWTPFPKFEQYTEEPSQTPGAPNTIKASVILLAACQEYEEAYENTFSPLIFEAVQERSVAQGYQMLLNALYGSSRSPSRMNAKMHKLGVVDKDFLNSKPFTIPN